MAATDGLMARIKAGAVAQQEAWDRETEADAMVDARDDDLDDVVRDFADQLLFTVKDRTSPRFTLYFDQRPANVIKLGLESELAKVKPWLAQLEGEPEKQLKAFGPRLQAAVTDGAAALAQRVTAHTERALHRARELSSLVDDLNAARRSLYGVLLQRGEEHKLASDWPERFFMHASKSPKAPAAAAATAPAAKS